MLQTQNVDAVIAIGCVIQGQTKHFDFVCEGVTQGIKDLNVQTDIPVIFCVLTDNNIQQSIDRSGGIHGNKGTEAAIAAIKMAYIRQQASLSHQLIINIYCLQEQFKLKKDAFRIEKNKNNNINILKPILFHK